MKDEGVNEYELYTFHIRLFGLNTMRMCCGRVGQSGTFRLAKH